MPSRHEHQSYCLTKLFRDEGNRDDRRNATHLLRSDDFYCHVYRAMNIHSAIPVLGTPYMRIGAQLCFPRTYRLLLQSCSFSETLVLVRHPTRCSITQNMTISTCRNFINPLTPNDPYWGRTAPLTSKRCILYIYSTGTEYFKHGIYPLFFPLQSAVCFIILTYLVTVLFTFYIQDVLKLKKKIRR